MKINKKAVKIIATVVAAAGVVGAGIGINQVFVPKNMQYKVENVSAQNESTIKVGIISDTQLPQVEDHLYGWDYMTVTSGPSHLVRAMKYFKEQKVDMIILNGDVVNATGDYAAYSAYNKVLDYVFGDDRKDMPHLIYPMGNHEFYGGNQEHSFYKATGLPLNARTIINGYSFISISNAKLQKGDAELAASNGTLADGTYNEKRLEFLKEQLENAKKEAPEKPIFVFLHMPIDSAIVGGHWATPQYEKIYEILKDYPQAVLFTSHSHYCLSDERSIVQKDFTMINTGTSSYFDFDWLDLDNKDSKYYGLTTEDLLKGTKPVLKNKDYLINPQLIGINKSEDVPCRDQVNNGFILNVDCKNNSFALDKVNFNTCLTFGDEFKMSAFTKDSFQRTPEKLGKGNMPIFKNKNITATVSGSDVIVSFGVADTKKPVKYYQYELTDSQGNMTPVRFFSKNYILGSELPYNEQNIIRSLNKGSYVLKVYAINSFNLKSESYLETDFTIS